jgi:hypothetical protein
MEPRVDFSYVVELNKKGYVAVRFNFLNGFPAKNWTKFLVDFHSQHFCKNV